jgi:hypothetical protein
VDRLWAKFGYRTIFLGQYLQKYLSFVLTDFMIFIYLDYKIGRFHIFVLTLIGKLFYTWAPLQEIEKSAGRRNNPTSENLDLLEYAAFCVNWGSYLSRMH